MAILGVEKRWLDVNATRHGIPVQPLHTLAPFFVTSFSSFSFLWPDKVLGATLLLQLMTRSICFHLPNLLFVDLMAARISKLDLGSGCLRYN